MQTALSLNSVTELQHDNLKGLDVYKEMTEVRRSLELKTLTCWKRNPTNLPSCYRQGWTKQREDLYDGVQSNTIAIQYCICSIQTWLR